MLFTKAQESKLLKNGAADNAAIAKDGETADFVPVVKLFYPAGAGTWLLTAIDPENPGIAYGLADLGFGSPEIGSIDLDELRGFRGRAGLGIERERYTTLDKPLSVYASEAREAGHITA
jgi:hypothetical protein